MKLFRTYQLAVTFYKATAHLRLPTHLKDQLQRSASSVVLNLAEGSGKQTAAEQRRYFLIAFASVRECQANLVLANLEDSEAAKFRSGWRVQLKIPSKLAFISTIFTMRLADFLGLEIPAIELSLKPV